MFENIEIYKEFEKIYTLQIEEVNVDKYKLKNEESHNFNLYKTYEFEEEVTNKLSNKLSERFIEDLYKNLDRIKYIQKNEWGNKEVYFKNSKKQNINVTTLYNYLISEDLITPVDLLNEVSTYIVEYNQNGYVNVNKNEMLCEMIKVLKYLKIENQENDNNTLINQFKALISPDNEKNYEQSQQQFNYICKRLKDEGYLIYLENEVFFDLNKIKLGEFANNRIRSFLIQREGYSTVPWDHRRMLIEELKFIKQTSLLKPSIIKELGEINFMEVNPNNYDQTLVDINNYIEYKLKIKKDTYRNIDEEISYDSYKLLNKLIDNRMIKRYRSQLQCYRHHSPEDKEERKKYSEKEKEILISYGHTICLLINEINIT